MKYFIKEAMAATDFTGNHVQLRQGSRGYQSEIMDLEKEVGAAGYGPKALRRSEPVKDFPQMKMFRDYAKKHENVLRTDLKDKMPFHKARKKYEDATSLVYKKHTPTCILSEQLGAHSMIL
jgi:hypothetical protein